MYPTITTVHHHSPSLLLTPLTRRPSLLPTPRSERKMAEDTIRNRKLSPTSGASAPPPPPSLSLGPTDEGDDPNISKGISLLDVLRVLTGALLLSSIFSWFVTDGESITWGYKPKSLRWNSLKNLFVIIPLPPSLPIHTHLSIYLRSIITNQYFISARVERTASSNGRATLAILWRDARAANLYRHQRERFRRLGFAADLWARRRVRLLLWEGCG